MSKQKPSKIEKIALAIAAIVLFVSVIAVFATSGKCDWCPPTACYGPGECAECVCIQDAYPEPGYCASLEG